MSENSVISHFQKSRFSVAISIREKSIFPSFFVEFCQIWDTFLRNWYSLGKSVLLFLNDASFRRFLIS